MDDAFRHFCGTLNGLAFLPVHDVKDGMSHLKTVMPASAADVVKYFDETYVTGSVRSAQSGQRRLPARFPPVTWNVHDVTLQGDSRTNNHSEGWNNHLAHTIGHKRPSVWRLIEALQADNAEAASRVARHAVGTLSPKKQSKAVRTYTSGVCRCCARSTTQGNVLWRSFCMLSATVCVWHVCRA